MIETIRFIKMINAGNFQYDSALRDIHVPEGVTDLSDHTFECCINLKHVLLPKSLKRIGNSAFANCINLQYINFPQNIEIIGDHAFQGCVRLLSVDLSDTKLEALPYDSFADCRALKAVKLPETLQKLDMSVFARCNDLSALELPEAVTEITSAVRTSVTCDNLKSIKALQAIINKDQQKVVWHSVIDEALVQPKQEPRIDFDPGEFRRFIGYAKNYLNEAHNDLTQGLIDAPTDAIKYVCEARLKEIKTELAKCERFLEQ